MSRRSFLLFVTAATAAANRPSLAQENQKPGGFGIAIDVDGEGFFLNPTLKTVTVKSVAPGRPAAEAGIKPGDQIIEVEGKLVAGTKARELEPLMKKNVGEKLVLRVKRATGEVFTVTLVAAAKPN